jgi:riboflavin synthase
MFTGIVEEIGEVTDVAPSGDGVRLTVRAPKAVSDAAHGDSISVSGVCLTVVDQGEDWFTADVMKQTLDMSTLGGVGAGRAVNLERATQAHGRLGGHIVQGHIDGTGEVLEVRSGAQWRVLRISLSAALAPLVVDKGSIAVDGVSLTVSAVSAADAAPTAHWFEVSLIPETLEATTLGARGAGDSVNLETDILARHVQRLLSFPAAAVPALREAPFPVAAAASLREASFPAAAVPALREGALPAVHVHSAAEAAFPAVHAHSAAEAASTEGGSR